MAQASIFRHVPSGRGERAVTSGRLRIGSHRPAHHGRTVAARSARRGTGVPWRKRPLAGLKTRISAMRSPRERCCLVTRPLGGLGEPVSIIVALKDGDEMYLGTDSRFMNPEETAPVSDSVQKIHSVGPGAFIATSGYQHACSFQAARAPELARALCITDIEVIGEALARESLPTLRELVAFLSAIVQRGPAGGYKDGADQKGGRLMPVSGERSKPMSKTGRGCAEGVPSVTLRADNPVHVKVLILAQI